MIKLIKEYLEIGIKAYKSTLEVNELSIEALKIQMNVCHLHAGLIFRNTEIANHHWNLIVAEDLKQKQNSEI